MTPKSQAERLDEHDSEIRTLRESDVLKSEQIKGLREDVGEIKAGVNRLISMHLKNPGYDTSCTDGVHCGESISSVSDLKKPETVIPGLPKNTPPSLIMWIMVGLIAAATITSAIVGTVLIFKQFGVIP